MRLYQNVDVFVFALGAERISFWAQPGTTVELETAWGLRPKDRSGDPTAKPERPNQK